MRSGYKDFIIHAEAKLKCVHKFKPKIEPVDGCRGAFCYEKFNVYASEMFTEVTKECPVKDCKLYRFV